VFSTILHQCIGAADIKIIRKIYLLVLHVNFPLPVGALAKFLQYNGAANIAVHSSSSSHSGHSGCPVMLAFRSFALSLPPNHFGFLDVLVILVIPGQSNETYILLVPTVCRTLPIH
jgi:hypothetical protein